MIKSDKKVNELAKNLNNPDVLIAAAAIDLLRNTEPFEGCNKPLDKTLRSMCRNEYKVTNFGFSQRFKRTPV